MSTAPFKGAEPGAKLKPPPHPKHGPEETFYVYQDAAGRPLFAVCRYRVVDDDGEEGKTFLQGRPNGGGSWAWNLRGITPVLYRLPEVLDFLRANDEHAPLYIVEGEKAVDYLNDYLREHELPGFATTNPMGAGKWKDDYTDTLRGARRVVIVADNDEVGIKGARKVAADVAPHVGRVETHRVALEAKHAGLDDHLASGLGFDDLLPLDDPIEETPGELASGDLLMSAKEFVALQVVSPPPLWGTDEMALVPEGGLVLFAGRPGTGKTTLIIDLVCHLAAGLPWPPRDEATERAPAPWPTPRPLRIALLENEGPIELFRDKLKRKLQAFPHDFDELGGYLGIQTWRWGGFNFADDDAFTKAAVEFDEKAIDLVVGDPLNMLGVEGVGSPADTRVFVHRLRMLGLGTRRAFLLIHHFRERVETHEDELRKLSGAWSGHLDTLITLAQDAAPAQVRLAFPKLRWARGEPPKPIILGKVYNLAAFEALGLEDDVAILEPQLVEGLAALREAGDGYGGAGWITATRLAAKIQRKRDLVTKALEGAPHLFVLKQGLEAKDIDPKVKSNTKLWGLKGWDGSPDEPTILADVPDQPDGVEWR